MMTVMLRAKCAVILALVGSAILFAQIQPGPATTVSISGRVVDQTTAPMSNVVVSLDVPGSSAPGTTTKTNQSGDFAFPAVPPREYKLDLRRPGFRPFTATVPCLRDCKLPTIVLSVEGTDDLKGVGDGWEVPLMAYPVTQTLKPQSDRKEPIEATLCQVVASPDSFNGKLVQFRTLVATGSESSVLRDEHCFADVWLSMGDDSTPPAREFAYMRTFWDFRTPEHLAWKPVPPLQPIVLRRDKAYRCYWKLIEKQCKSKGPKSTSSRCPYRVAVTFTGRFDYSDGRLIVTRDVESKRIVGIGAIRFGHMGGWNSQLVVQSVSDVVATPIEPTEVRP